jgi:hypothetical protein
MSGVSEYSDVVGCDACGWTPVDTSFVTFLRYSTSDLPVSRLGYVNTIGEPTASDDKRYLLDKDPKVPMLRSTLQSLAVPIRTIKRAIKNL